MLKLSDRIWLAWRVLRGYAVSFKADPTTFTVDFYSNGEETRKLTKWRIDV